MALHEDFLEAPPPDVSASPAAKARIATTAMTDDEQVYVLIDSFDGGARRHGPCPWMPRGATRPSEGDHALVIVDEEENPWIICWWPYAL